MEGRAFPAIAALAAIAAIATTFGMATVAEAKTPKDYTIGVGVVLGEPTGLTAKHWFDDTHALDAHLSFDFTDEAFAVSSNYLFHFDILQLRTDAVELPLYVGIGGKLLFDAGNEQGDKKADKDNDFFSLGARVPFGADLLFTRIPLEIFIEVGIGVRVIPATRPDLDGGLGVRYYF
jgi:hypothetical protein